MSDRLTSDVGSQRVALSGSYAGELPSARRVDILLDVAIAVDLTGEVGGGGAGVRWRCGNRMSETVQEAHTTLARTDARALCSGRTNPPRLLT